MSQFDTATTHPANISPVTTSTTMGTHTGTVDPNDTLVTLLNQSLQELEELKTNNNNSVTFDKETLEKLDRIKKELDGLTKNKEDEKNNKKEIENYINKIKNFNTQIENLEKNINSNEKHIKTMNPDTQDNIRNEISNNIAKIGLKDGEIGDLKRDIEALKAKINIQNEGIRSNNKLWKDKIPEMYNETHKLLKQIQSNKGEVGNKLEALKQLNKNLYGNKSSKDQLGKFQEGGRQLYLEKLSRKELNTLGKQWGIKNCRKYKNKQDLKHCLKLLFIYKKGGRKFSRHDLNVVAKNLDINPKNYKKKKVLSNFINHKTRFI